MIGRGGGTEDVGVSDVSDLDAWWLESVNVSVPAFLLSARISACVGGAPVSRWKILELFIECGADRDTLRTNALQE